MLPQVDRAAPLLNEGERLLLEHNYRPRSREYNIMPNTSAPHKRTHCTDDAEGENTHARKRMTEDEKDKEKAKILISPENTQNVYSPLPLDCCKDRLFFFFASGTMQHMSDLRRCNSDNLCTYYKACKELETLKDQQESLLHKMKRIDDILKTSPDTIKRNLNYLVDEYSGTTTTTTTTTPNKRHDVEKSEPKQYAGHVYSPATNFLGVNRLDVRKTPEQEYMQNFIFAIPAPIQPR